MIKLFSEINALSETKVKWKLGQNMLGKLFWKIASLKIFVLKNPLSTELGVYICSSK